MTCANCWRPRCNRPIEAARRSMAFGCERTRGQPMSEINVTPLVDVMLVLVVIFIITAPLLASRDPAGPAASNLPASQRPPAFVTLVVDPAGQGPTARRHGRSKPGRAAWADCPAEPRHRSAAARRPRGALRSRGRGDGRGPCRRAAASVSWRHRSPPLRPPAETPPSA